MLIFGNYIESGLNHTEPVLRKETGAVIARTDLDGDIAVTGPADALRVVPRGR